MKQRGAKASVQSLNDFANALRDCLGLAPLPRHTTRRVKQFRPPPDTVDRFYVKEWAEPFTVHRGQY